MKAEKYGSSAADRILPTRSASPGFINQSLIKSNGFLEKYIDKGLKIRYEVMMIGGCISLFDQIA